MDQRLGSAMVGSMFEQYAESEASLDESSSVEWSRTQVALERAQRRASTTGHFGIWILAGCLGSIVSIFAYLDVFGGVSAISAVRHGVLLLGLLVSGCYFALLRRGSVIALAAGFCIAVLAVSSADFSPRKPFVAFYDDIRSGMTANEVLGLLHAHFPIGGRYRVPFRHRADGRMTWILDPTDMHWNAEWVTVDMKNGRVTTKAYAFD